MGKEVWRPVVPLLAREREVIAVDLPGFGASPPGPHTVEGLAHAWRRSPPGSGSSARTWPATRWAAGSRSRWARAARVRSVCARVAGRLRQPTARWPTRARVLVGTRGMSRVLVPVAPTVARNRVLRTTLTSHIVARPWRVPAGDTVLWARMCAEAPSFMPLLRSAPDWRVEPASCPTTVAWGERDRLLIFSRQAPRARRVLPQARHVTLTGCGHVPTWDDPEQVARVLLEASA